MAVSRTVRPVTFSRGKRRATSWREVQPTVTTVTGAGGTILASLDAEELAKRPFTIVRTHLVWSLQSDQLGASEQYGGALGFAVVSEQAEGIGVTAVPHPVLDAGSDLWFVHQWMIGSFIFGSGVGFLEPNDRFGVIDSKAMRKVNDDQDVVLVHELSTVLGGGQIISVAGRVLIKEH